MFFIIRFLIVWAIWLLFADKKRWREIFPVSLFSNALGSTSDTIAIHYLHLWDYHGGNPMVALLCDDWGIYLVATYLFIQWLPKKKTWKRMFLYWLVWTSITIGIEYYHLVSHHLEYHNGWSMGWSYVADWVIFTVVYGFYKLFKFEEAYRCLREK